MHFLQKPAPRRAAPLFLRKIIKLSARALSTWRGRGSDFGANVVWMVYHVFAGAGVLKTGKPFALGEILPSLIRLGTGVA